MIPYTLTLREDPLSYYQFVSAVGEAFPLMGVVAWVGRFLYRWMR